jgi:hypothetical protein
MSEQSGNIGVVARRIPKRQAGIEPWGETSELELATVILQAFNEGQAMTKMQTLALAPERHSPNLVKGWLHASVWRHLDALLIYRSLP